MCRVVLCPASEDMACLLLSSDLMCCLHKHLLSTQKAEIVNSVGLAIDWSHYRIYLLYLQGLWRDREALIFQFCS